MPLLLAGDGGDQVDVLTADGAVIVIGPATVADTVCHHRSAPAWVSGRLAQPVLLRARVVSRLGRGRARARTRGIVELTGEVLAETRPCYA
ncbi:hypothetical protein ACFQX7_29670 [Luedemannella flava]